MKLLMISGKGASETAAGKRGAFWNTLEELRTHFDRIDILCPQISNFQPARWSGGLPISNPFPNTYFHSTDHIVKTGLEIYREHHFDVMTVHEYAPFRNGRAANRI